MSEDGHSKSGSAASGNDKESKTRAEGGVRRRGESRQQRSKDADVATHTGRDARVRLPAHMEPTFYIGGGNGVALVEEVCVNLGWKRTTDKKDDNYRFKWCEIKGNINYYTFREGEQMVNHIPNCNLLTNKLGLLNSLQEYDRMCQAVKKRAMRLDFIPETFRLDDPRDKNVFRQTYQDGEQWICKPTGKNQSKGIFIVKSQDEVNKIFEEQEDRMLDGKPMKPLNRIIQRYVGNPLLLNNKKFDIRCYMLVASTVPYLVLYHKGYIRLSIHDYDNNTDNLIAHLTNQFIQKKDPSYKEVKEDTTWSMEKFNDYVNDNYQHTKGIDRDWAMTVLPSRMKQIMTYCFNCVKSRLQCKIGYHDLYGFDFMVDDNMKIWLIEVNVNPCLAINCEALREVIPGVVKDTIHIANECFEKSRKGRAILPLNSMGGFEVIFSHGAKTSRKSIVSSPYRKDMASRATHNSDRRVSSSPTPLRRPPTVTSPVKEPTVVAPALDANVTHVAKSSAAATAGVTQYSMNKPGSLSSKAAASVRVRNTPTATPTIITPGGGLPVPQRSVTFAQLKGAGPPSNAASSLKVTIGTVRAAPAARPPTRQASSKPAAAAAGKDPVASSTKQEASVLAKPTPKPSAGMPSSAKSSVNSAKASVNSAKASVNSAKASVNSAKASVNNAKTPVDSVKTSVNGAKTSGDSAKTSTTVTEKAPVSSSTAARKTSRLPAAEPSEPPHHYKIKKELRNKMTASEAILIRNITKQNVSTRRSSTDKQSSRSNKRVYSSASEFQSKPIKGVTMTSLAKNSPVKTSSATAASNPTHKPEAESELSDDDDADDVSLDSCHNCTDLTIDVGLEPQTVVEEPATDVRKSQSETAIPSPRAVHTVQTTHSSLALDTKPTKKISLQLSPHGSRSSKDGGKPEMMAMRFAAMYPSSPYIDTPSGLAVAHGNATVPQLRMTHNGIIHKPKRVGGVIQQEANRGS